jgi:protein-S-isoprenylcysteine O-methyltransferase Ste14
MSGANSLPGGDHTTPFVKKPFRPVALINLSMPYRRRRGAGSAGMERVPDAVIQTGPYSFTRNPLYLGHLIFLTGLVLTLRSRVGCVILLANIPWFHARVLRDEARLRQAFGADYERYCAVVPRWIPGCHTPW